MRCKRGIMEEFRKGSRRRTRRLRTFVNADLEAPRSVGRKALPTTVGGLLVHCADHTQRHTGQAVTTAKTRHRCKEESGRHRAERLFRTETFRGERLTCPWPLAPSPRFLLGHDAWPRLLPDHRSLDDRSSADQSVKHPLQSHRVESVPGPGLQSRPLPAALPA